MELYANINEDSVVPDNDTLHFQSYWLIYQAHLVEARHPTIFRNEYQDHKSVKGVGCIYAKMVLWKITFVKILIMIK